MRVDTSQTTCQSGSTPFGGSTAFRMRWMRRSKLVKVPSFSRNEAPGMHQMRQLGRLAEKQILHDEELQILQRLMDFVQIGIRLRHIVPDDPQALQTPVQRGIPHVRSLHASRRGQRTTGDRLVRRRTAQDHRTIDSRQNMWGRHPDVGRALHIVLAAQAG